MNVPTALPWRKPTVASPRAASARTDDPGIDAGCGWFESSHDLARGLVVCEHASAAAVPGDALALADWLALQRADWSGSGRPA